MFVFYINFLIIAISVNKVSILLHNPFQKKTLCHICSTCSYRTGVQCYPRCSDGNYRTPPVLDTYGHHASVCPSADGSVRRHNSLHDRFISLIANSAFLLYLRREWQFPHDNDLAFGCRRRLDFYIEDDSFARGPHGFDVTVISPHSHPYVATRNASSQNALAAAEDSKVDRYGTLCQELGITFHPMAIDIYGAVGMGFETGVDLIARYISSRRGTCPVTERSNMLTQSGVQHESLPCHSGCTASASPSQLFSIMDQGLNPPQSHSQPPAAVALNSAHQPAPGQDSQEWFLPPSVADSAPPASPTAPSSPTPSVRSSNLPSREPTCSSREGPMGASSTRERNCKE